MINGIPVFDAAVHAHDFRDEMIINEDGRFLKRATKGDLAFTERNGQRVSYEVAEAPPGHDWCNRVLFEESDTDVAMVQTVPLFGAFKEGMTPARAAYELTQSNPDRYYFCGGVDPIFQGLKGALEDMERQVDDWGAISIKFYQAQTMRLWWGADDEKLAYPLFEKAQELGIKVVQFHKGLPLGRQRVESLRPNDLQQAAYDFPDLTFAMHHLGDPYVDETISIAARFPNITLVLPLLFNQWFVQPKKMLHRLGELLLHVGEDRLVYGTDAFLWPGVQLYIDLINGLEMPEELQEDYGYPAITEETKRKILGENFARLFGIDLAAKTAALAA